MKASTFHTHTHTHTHIHIHTPLSFNVAGDGDMFCVRCENHSASATVNHWLYCHQAISSWLLDDDCLLHR